MRLGSIGHIQKYGPETCEAITRLASLTDANRLTDRQLKPSDSGDALHACEIVPPQATHNPTGARTNQTRHGVYEAVQPAFRIRHSPALRYRRYLD
jgi:hypothetical protein